MSKLRATNTAQNVKSIVFEWNYNDTMLDVDGVETELGTNSGESVVDGVATFVIGYLPKGARIIGGEVARQVAFDTAGYDITVGDLDDDDEYLTSTDIKAAGVTALVPTGLEPSTENTRTIVMTLASDDVCTTGKAYVRVDYVVPGRSDEVTHPGA